MKRANRWLRLYLKWIGFGFSFVLIYRPLFSDHQQAFVFTALICNSKAICNINYLHVLTLDIPLTKLRCMSQVEGFNSKPHLKSVFFMEFYDQHPSSCMCYGGAPVKVSSSHTESDCLMVYCTDLHSHSVICIVSRLWNCILLKMWNVSAFSIFGFLIVVNLGFWP